MATYPTKKPKQHRHGIFNKEELRSKKQELTTKMHARTPALRTAAATAINAIRGGLPLLQQMPRSDSCVKGGLASAAAAAAAAAATAAAAAAAAAAAVASMIAIAVAPAVVSRVLQSLLLLHLLLFCCVYSHCCWCQC